MQTNQCFNNHWTFSASAVSSTGVPKERVPTERIAPSFSRSKRWPGEVPRQRALRRGPGSAHVLRLINTYYDMCKVTKLQFFLLRMHKWKD